MSSEELYGTVSKFMIEIHAHDMVHKQTHKLYVLVTCSWWHMLNHILNLLFRLHSTSFSCYQHKKAYFFEYVSTTHLHFPQILLSPMYMYLNMESCISAICTGTHCCQKNTFNVQHVVKNESISGLYLCFWRHSLDKSWQALNVINIHKGVQLDV